MFILFIVYIFTLYYINIKNYHNLQYNFFMFEKTIGYY